MNIINKNFKNKNFYYIFLNIYYKFINIIKKIYLLIIIFFILNNFIKNGLNNIKICVCTIGKNENRYIREFISYYIKYGVDKIILYDNNNIDGERFEKQINDFIYKRFVEIKNWRGIKHPQIKMYNNCYKLYNRKFEWLIFSDIDEFIFLKSYSNIKDYLKQSKFNNCQSIQLNWLLYTDNNLTFYQNQSLEKRFTETESIKKRIINIYSNGKTLLRGHISNINLTGIHIITKKLKNCDGFGNIIKSKFIKFDFKNYYFKHYYSKSLEEFVEKLKKGDVLRGTIKEKIKRYFKYNEITSNRIYYLEKHLNVDLYN